MSNVSVRASSELIGITGRLTGIAGYGMPSSMAKAVVGRMLGPLRAQVAITVTGANAV